MLAQSALNAWAEVANLTFVQTSGTANITFTHNGTMTAWASSGYNGSGIISSATVNISADWITNDGGAYDGKTGIDSYGYQTYLHEIGHALGLGHQGPYNGSASYSSNALYANDTWQYSLMSYFAQSNYGSSYRYVITPQMADIYAIQAIYGAATTRTGDTVYGFSNTAGSIFDFASYSQAPALTIYDSGGNDTLNCSGYSTAQIIDLRAGAFCSVGGLTNNIGIALATNIENAIGGSGNDTLISNDLGCTLTGGAGNDTLTGGAGIDWLFGGIGVDTMNGGGGADTFVFAFGDSSAASGQHDRINGFIAGVDRIDLSAIDAIAASGTNDLFRFIGTSAFSGTAGELNYFYNSSLGVTVVQGDTNGDRVADFAIDLAGNIVLGAGDFIGVVAGPPPIVIEAFGSTQLSQSGSNYYLYSVSAGPSIKYAGTAIVQGQFGNWTPIGAEQTAGGYSVVMKLGTTDQYIIWSTDSTGNYLSNSVVVAGSNSMLTSLESGFHQDLNGNGIIGASGTVIEAFGSTLVAKIANKYYLNHDGLGPSLKYAGVAIAQGQFGNWTPIGAEQTASGYSVVMKLGTADQYTIWSTDGSGNYLSNSVVIAGSSSMLTSLESSFHQDLNGDGIMPGSTTIEAFGSTQLTQMTGNYYVYAGGSGVTIKYAGSPITQGQFGSWTPIGAEQTAGGYSVVLKLGTADQYTIWSIDGSGNYLSNSSVVAGSQSLLTGQESSFQQDLNGDGFVPGSAVIEAMGSTQLTQIGSNYYLSTGGTGITIKYAGSPISQGQFGVWAPIGAEQTAGGYSVVMKLGTADQYTIWNMDGNGNYLSNSAVVAGSDTRVTSLESSFQQDLNGDGSISSSAATIVGSSATNPAQSTVALNGEKPAAFDIVGPLGDLDIHGWHFKTLSQSAGSGLSEPEGFFLDSPGSQHLTQVLREAFANIGGMHEAFSVLDHALTKTLIGSLHADYLIGH
ncbi:MAG: M10 family metallopeptidase C-terminal domain-containing protein [Pseudomonadota bacterium]